MVADLSTIAGHRGMVVTSAVIAMGSMYIALELADRVFRAPDRRTSRLWIAAGSLAMGSGLWATHFVGMAAADYPFRSTYALGLTMLSWVVAVVTAAFALDVAGRRTLRTGHRLWRSTIAGCGALAMHFVGTEAMIVRPQAVYDPTLVFVAGLVMVGGTIMSLKMFLKLRGLDGPERVRRQLASAAVYGGSLAAMHYTGMASTGFAAGTICITNQGLDATLLGNFIGFAALVFFGVVLLMTTLERQSANRARKLNGSLIKANEQLRFVTFNDPVTGLPNRLVFQDRLKHAVARCDRSGDSLAVLFVDLDGFRGIEHSWGNDHGDHTLRIFSNALLKASRQSDTVANIGGDQFLVMVEGLRNMQPAVQLAERFAAILKSTWPGDYSALCVTASIGITAYPADGQTHVLVGNASVAATAAKKAGGNGYRFFEPKMNAAAHAQSEWLADLRLAVDREELVLYYQPSFHGTTGRLAGAEALLRWQHPTRGMVSPGIFIPLAEQFGMINELGSWVIENVCRQIAAWSCEGISLPIALNLSVHQLRNPTIADQLARALARHGVDPSLLTCEITESGAMEDSTDTLVALERLRAVGVQLSIDDFGTGYSSLSYLRRLPVRQLKIDQSFVRDLETSEDARLIVKGIIDLAHALRLEVVAEGVETTGQQHALLELRCDKLQGFLLARPMPAGVLALRPDVVGSARSEVPTVMAARRLGLASA